MPPRKLKRPSTSVAPKKRTPTKTLVEEEQQQHQEEEAELVDNSNTTTTTMNEEYRETESPPKGFSFLYLSLINVQRFVEILEKKKEKSCFFCLLD